MQPDSTRSDAGRRHVSCAGTGDRRTVVRRATPADATALEALYRQLVADPVAVRVDPGRLSPVAADGATTVLVVDRDGQVCATALVTLCADIMYAAQPFAVVDNVVVDAAVRSKGIGTLLFSHIESMCKAADCSKIMLLSAVSRTDAHRFFERLGFEGAAKRGFVKYRRNFTHS